MGGPNLILDDHVPEVQDKDPHPARLLLHIPVHKSLYFLPDKLRYIQVGIIYPS